MSSERLWNKGKSTIVLLLTVAMTACLFSACAARDSIAFDTAIIQSGEKAESDKTVEENTQAAVSTQPSPSTEPSQNMTSEEPAMDKELTLTINGQSVSVEWEENESVEALKDLVKDKTMTIQMSMYGGFEQVGSFGTSLPRNDSQTTTAAGDIVLYSGNQIVVFYGSNSWAYTRLGHITDKTAAEMSELLGNGDVTITISN